MTFHAPNDQADLRHVWFLRVTVLLAVATFGVYALPLSSTSLLYVKEFLLLVAFALPLWPLSRARRVSSGGDRLSWLLLMAGCAAGLAGQVLWIVYRTFVGSTASFAPAEIGYVAFMLFTTVALALGVSANGRSGLRAELVIDLLLIGTIGLLLVREIFSLLPESHTVDAFELAMGGVNLIAALALGVAALGALISPSVLGGGVPRLLIVFSGFVAAVARTIFAYNHFFGLDTNWLTPAWIFSLLMIAAAATERASSGAEGREAKLTSSGSPLRTLVVPMIVAYGLSLLIRLGTGGQRYGLGLPRPADRRPRRHRDPQLREARRGAHRLGAALRDPRQHDGLAGVRVGPEDRPDPAQRRHRAVLRRRRRQRLGRLHAAADARRGSRPRRG
jgi:hypothetical protein